MLGLVFPPWFFADLMSFHYSAPQAAGADAVPATFMQSYPFPSFFLVFSMLSEQLQGWTLPKGQHLCTVPVGAAVDLGASRAAAPLLGCAARSSLCQLGKPHRGVTLG